MAVGVGMGLVVSVAGIVTVPVSAVAALLLWRRPAARRSVPGLMSGAGLVPLYVAFLNRGGPGEACSRTATSVTCSELVSPWPWLIAGALLVGAGLVAHRTGRRD